MNSARNEAGHGPGFTLVEFILVMALLATVMALSAPMLAGFFRQRTLEQEAVRFVALTEFGRSEAVSQGIPMVVWVDPLSGDFGLEPKAGYRARETVRREYLLHPEVRFELEESPSSRDAMVDVAEFGPDGTLSLESLERVVLVDKRGAELVVAQSTNGWRYEVLKTADYELREAQRR